MIAHTSLVYVLISMFGGGTIVPLVYTVFMRWRSKNQDHQRDTAQIEDLSSHAAREAVEATRGAIAVLRDQLKDGNELINVRNKQIKDLRERIKSNEEAIADLRQQLAARPQNFLDSQ